MNHTKSFKPFMNDRKNKGKTRIKIFGIQKSKTFFLKISNFHSLLRICMRKTPLFNRL